MADAERPEPRSGILYVDTSALLKLLVGQLPERSAKNKGSVKNKLPSMAALTEPIWGT